MSRGCDYSGPTNEDPQLRIKELEQLVACLLARSQTASSTTSYESAVNSSPLSRDTPSDRSFLRSKFLDSDVSEFISMPVIASGPPIPEEISDALGSRSDIDLMISHYFETVNIWMPIINLSRLERLLNPPSNIMRSDLALLLLSMKLILQVPNNDDAERSSFYITAKRFCFALEMEGTYSLLKVQAGLLIAMYEFGHAILPAAYTSIGSCARQGMCLGIHHQDAPQILRKARVWLDWEERQRVWWLIVILDRSV